MPPITEILFGDQDGQRVARGQTVADVSLPSALIAPITAADIAAGKRATEIAFGAAVPSSGYQLVIAADTQNYNVYNAFVAAYGVPPDDVELEVVVESGVVVSASTTATAALTWGNAWTGTPVFTLTNNGTIRGLGGAGGEGGVEGDASAPGGDGNAGGKAMELSGQTVSIDNGSGFILGGGGGGGGGAGGNLVVLGSGGGGGGGVALGAGGIGGDGFPPPNPNHGTDATATVPGVGGVADGSGAGGGDGADGGDFGAAGNNGSAGNGGAGGTGGAAGKAINLTGGTANFSSGSGSPNVKGAVS